MQIVPLSTRTKQTLAVVFLLITILLTFFATKAWAMEPEKKTKVETRKPVALVTTTTTTTSTTTTTTTAPKRIEVAPSTTAAPIIITGEDLWARLRNCETHGNYTTNTGNGYYGAYQFSYSTWNSMNTGYAYAHEAPPEVQDDAARRLQARSGWGQWPVCAKGFPQP